MKNKVLGFSFFLLVLSGLFISCDTEPLDSGLGGPPEPITQVLFATNFNGINYSTNSASASVENGMLTIQASNSTGVFVLHSISALVGTYNNNQLEFAYTDNETGNVYSSVNPVTENSSSTLTITSIDFQNQSISGTFSFIGYRLAESGETVVVEEMIFTQGTLLNIPYGAGIVDPVEPEPTTGDYFPMAVGNKWEYSNLTELSEIVSTQTIEGNLYYRMTGGLINAQDLTEDAEDYVRKENGDYYARVNYPSLGQSVEMIILKDYLNVGQSWNESFEIVLDDTPDEVTELTVTTTSTIEFKGSYTVNGINYPDVIKVASEVSSELLYNGEPFGENEPPLLHEYWYAKDVGLIKLRIEETPDEPEELHELLDYELF